MASNMNTTSATTNINTKPHNINIISELSRLTINDFATSSNLHLLEEAGLTRIPTSAKRTFTPSHVMEIELEDFASTQYRTRRQYDEELIASLPPVRDLFGPTVYYMPSGEAAEEFWYDRDLLRAKRKKRSSRAWRKIKECLGF